MIFPNSAESLCCSHRWQKTRGRNAIVDLANFAATAAVIGISVACAANGDSKNHLDCHIN